MNRPRHIARIVTALALVTGSVTAVAVTSSTAVAAVPTAPTAETARSLYANNWTDTTGLWMAPQLAQTDGNTQYGPRLGELHYSPHRRGCVLGREPDQGLQRVLPRREPMP